MSMTTTRSVPALRLDLRGRISTPTAGWTILFSAFTASGSGNTMAGQRLPVERPVGA